MAWYNNFGDLWGDITNLATNPIVDVGIGALTGGWTVPAIVGGLGGLLKPGGGVTSGLTGALTGGLAGEGGNLLKGLLGGSGAAAGAGVLGALGSGGGVQGLLSSLGLSNASGGIDLPKVALLGLGAAQMANAANLQKQANQYATGALDTVQQNYTQRQPLRACGMQQMLNPTIPDLSGLLANSGPYSVGLPRPGVQPAARYTGAIPNIV